MRTLRRLALPLGLVIALQSGAPASATVMTRHASASMGALTITCDDAPRATYAATTESGVPLSGSYAHERGIDKGLVRLMNAGGRRVRSFSIPRAKVRAAVRLKYNQTLPEWADVIFTRGAVVLVHTSTGNAGVFTGSDVYRLKTGKAGAVDTAPLKDDADLKVLLDLGLSAYAPTTGQCTPTA